MTEDHDAPYGCDHCGREFAREDWLALHRGLDHDDTLTPQEQAAYDAALEAEREELRLFQYKALAALIVLYFGFLLLFAFVRAV